MKTGLTALIVSLLVGTLGATTVFAASAQGDPTDDVAKARFKAHDTQSIAQPDIVTIDGRQVARRLEVSDSMKEQLNQAKSHVHVAGRLTPSI